MAVMDALQKIQGEDRMEAKITVILWGTGLYNYSVLVLSLWLCCHCLGGELSLQHYQSSFSDRLFIHLTAAAVRVQMDRRLSRLSAFIVSLVCRIKCCRFMFFFQTKDRLNFHIEICWNYYLTFIIWKRLNRSVINDSENYVSLFLNGDCVPVRGIMDLCHT